MVGSKPHVECARNREQLVLEQLDDPAIIHSAGPVHPAMVSVLHPTCKFNRCLLAQGHPYAGGAWDMLEKPT